MPHKKKKLRCELVVCLLGDNARCSCSCFIHTLYNLAVGRQQCHMSEQCVCVCGCTVDNSFFCLFTSMVYICCVDAIFLLSVYRFSHKNPQYVLLAKVMS